MRDGWSIISHDPETAQYDDYHVRHLLEPAFLLRNFPRQLLKPAYRLSPAEMAAAFSSGWLDYVL